MGAPEMYSDLYAEYLTGDPAYDKVFAVLADCPSFAQVQQALRTYAHELAEKQREWAKGRYGGVPTLAVAENTVMMAANLIDPAKESERG